MTRSAAPFYWVDAFTTRVFAGNPAAVCITERELDDSLMQNLAAEFGLSETAFVRPLDQDWHLRWFTPKAEVRLCGHATLATAKALWTHDPSLGPKLSFHTLSGQLHASQSSDSMIELEFPSRPPQSCPPPIGLFDALGLSESEVLWCGRDVDDYLLQLDKEAQLRALQPNFSALSSVETRGIIVTAKSSDEKRDIVSRFFAPRVGVDEDPVTGSAHCCLTPFWTQKLAKSCLRAEQLSSRSGELQVELKGDRVALQGQAQVLVKGEVLIP